MNIVDSSAQRGVMIINGQTIDLFNIQPRQISMPKMVQGLQGVVRFNGYSDWSVAQHSFLLANIIQNVTNNLFNQFVTAVEQGNVEKFNRLMPYFQGSTFSVDITNKENIDVLLKNRFVLAEYFAALLAYDALIHDFSEALTGDIIRPFKQLVPEIREMENKIDKQIRAIHGALPEMPVLVDLLDKQLATVEAYHLTRFYGKTLLTETDDFQVRAFNSVFSNEKAAYLNQLLVLEEVSEIEPISDSMIYRFLQQSAVKFEDIKTSSNEYLLKMYVDYAVKLKNTLKTINVDLCLTEGVK